VALELIIARFAERNHLSSLFKSGNLAFHAAAFLSSASILTSLSYATLDASLFPYGSVKFSIDPPQ
jgi:hypothetical protein